ncbi:MAG: RlmE family RNA methyltransferase [Desulfobacterales bacterium]|nr:RlmE family RNA methyltransferase [Desulfobacterales bacterium]
MKKKKSKNQNWEDYYSIKAKKEKFPARSVYKLKEIQEKYGLIKPGHKVLDLGCTPGSWLLYASEIAGKNGRLFGIDIVPIKHPMPSNVMVYEQNILSVDNEVFDEIGRDFDVVLSDMAPSTTGNKFTDSVRSFELSMAALNIAISVLKNDGHFVCKIFQGEDFQKFISYVKQTFRKYKIFKPKACRKESNEIYLIGIEKVMEVNNVGS